MLPLLKSYPATLIFTLIGLVLVLSQKQTFMTTVVITAQSSSTSQELEADLTPKALNHHYEILPQLALSKSTIEKLSNLMDLDRHFLSTDLARKGFSLLYSKDNITTLLARYFTVSYNESSRHTEINFHAYDEEISFNTVNNLITLIAFEVSRINRESTSQSLATISKKLLEAQRTYSYTTNHLAGFEAANGFTPNDNSVSGLIAEIIKTQQLITEKTNEIDSLSSQSVSASQDIFLLKAELATLKKIADGLGRQAMQDEDIQNLLTRHDVLRFEKTKAEQNLSTVRGKFQLAKRAALKEQVRLLIVQQPSKPVVSVAPDTAIMLFAVLYVLVFTFVIELIFKLKGTQKRQA